LVEAVEELELEEPEALLAAVPEEEDPLTVPLPEEAVPEEAVPAFWLPVPVKPGPLPAPWVRYFFAGVGIAGRVSFMTAQLGES